MSKVDRVLRRLYPGRDSFSEEERVFAERALAIARDENNRKRIHLKDVPIGGRFVRCGVEYECILRPGGLKLNEGCSGCDFDVVNSCNAPVCSKFDRADGCFVWFRRVEG